MTRRWATAHRLAARALLVVVVATLATACTRHWRIAHPQKQDLPLHQSLWAMDGDKGAKLTRKHKRGADTAALRRVFQSQIYLTYCGVASAVMALRALNISDVSQESFFTDAAEKVRSQDKVFYGGMTLDELGGLLRAHGAQTLVVHAGETTEQAFRERLQRDLERAGDVVLVNYLRKSIHQRTGGHISPVAAYDAETDRALVMDVSTYKYPPVWVRLPDLFRAMNTVDSSANKTRGWVHVMRAPTQEATP